MSKVRLKQLAQDGASANEVVKWNDGTGQWEPGTGGGATARARAAASADAAITAGTTITNALLTGDNLVDYSALTFDTDVEIHINGRIMRNGTGNDTEAAGTAANGDFKCSFDLFAGDTIQMFGPAEVTAVSDAAAIHDDVADEINQVTLKGTPEATDVLLIEDNTGGTWVKKKIAISSLPGGAPAEDSITNAMLAEMAANTVKANATAGTDNPTNVAVGTNTVLGRVAGNIVAAQLVNTQITDDTIADGKLANMAANTVKVNATTGSANPTNLAVAASQVVGRAAAGDLVAQQVETSQIEDAAVTLAKMDDMATASFIGRDTATTGVPEVLSGADATVLLDIATTTLKGLAPATTDTDSAKYLSADGTYSEPSGGSGINPDGTTPQDAALFTERADHVNTPATGKSEIWLENTAVQSLRFTDEADTDHYILRAFDAEAVDNEVVTFDGTGGRTQSTTGTTLGQNSELVMGGSDAGVSMVEKNAEAGDGVGTGIFWVRDDTPCTPIFTDDEGTDFDLTAGSGHGTGTVGQHDDVDLSGIQDGEVLVWATDTLVAGAAVTDFLSLTDVDEDTYTGQGGKGVYVNSAETDLEFIQRDVSTGDVQSITETATGVEFVLDVDVSSLPADCDLHCTYQINHNDAAGDSVELTFNNNSTSNYNTVYGWIDAAGNALAAGTSGANIDSIIISASPGPGDPFAQGSFIIPDFKGTDFAKGLHGYSSFNGSDLDTSIRAQFVQGQLKTLTGAITSIQFKMASGFYEFEAGSYIQVHAVPKGTYAAGSAGTLDETITGGTPDNDVTIPTGDPVIFRDGDEDITPLSIIKINQTPGTEPAVKIVVNTDSTPAIHILNPLSNDALVLGDNEVTFDGDSPGVVSQAGTGSLDVASSGGGDLNIGADAAGLRLGYGTTSPPTEIELVQGFTVNETADHPVTPVDDKGQFWVNADGEPIFTSAANAAANPGTDYDLTMQDRDRLTKSITVEDPTAAENISMFFTTVAITVTQLTAVLQNTTSVTYTIRHQPAAAGSGRGDIGNEVVTGGVVANSLTAGVITTSFNDETIAADSFVWLETTALDGAPDSLNVTIEYTED